MSAGTRTPDEPSTGPPDGVALVGPTASGKSALALQVAVASACGASTKTAAPPEVRVELVSVDSMAVYRGMDIGTAKPTPEDRSRATYHLLDLVDVHEEFTVQDFQAAARESLAAIASRGHRALLVGGTGLYLRSVVDDLAFPGRFPDVRVALDAEVDAVGPPGGGEQRAVLASLHARLAARDPAAAARIEPSNRRRLVRALEVTLGSGRPFSSYGPGLEAYPPRRFHLVGIRLDPQLMDQRIAERFETLMELGFLDEVRSLAGRAGGISRTARQALGYRELLAHLEEGVPLADAVAEAIRRTRALARRQWAWFRRDPRIVWLDPDADPAGRIAGLLAGEHGRPATVGD